MRLAEKLKQNLKDIKTIINNYMQPTCNLNCKYVGCNCCSECKHNRKYKDYYSPIKYK